MRSESDDSSQPAGPVRPGHEGREHEVREHEVREDVPAPVVTAVGRVLAYLDDLAVEVFDATALAEPALAELTPAGRDDVRRWQQYLIASGLSGMMTGRSFAPLGTAITKTSGRRSDLGVTFALGLAMTGSALRIVYDALVRELGPERTPEALAYMNNRLLEFVRLHSLTSSGDAPGTPAAVPDRAALMSTLLDQLCAGRGMPPEALELADRLGVLLPPRHAVAVGGDADPDLIATLLPGSVVAQRAGLVVILSAAAVSLPGMVQGTAQVDDGGVGAAVDAARRALGVALAVGRPFVDDASARTLAAVLELDPAARSAAVRACFGELPEIPRGGELLDTVAAVLTAGSAAAAARQLHLHRHTLEYRLRRFQELTGQDLGDPVVRLQCQLGLLLLGRWPTPNPP